MRKKISQVEAHNLRHQVRRLEAQIRGIKGRWMDDYPANRNIVNVDVEPEVYMAVKTARLLGHPVLVSTAFDKNRICLFADVAQ